MKEISASHLRDIVESPDIALIDVREPAEYNLAHIGGACSLPRRLVEFSLTALVPWQGTPIVVCDDDGRRASLAAGTIEAMGYSDVSVLGGGVNRWVTEGGSTEWGVNVPSKDFGEKVLLTHPVPEITPDELFAKQQRGERLVILDSRTPEEHQRACIPGSRSMPGAELGLRAAAVVPTDDTTIVVHCAGRTRSIIGAATLRRMGLPNVVALKNGTMGWQLAGLELETKSDRVALPEPSPTAVEEGERRVRDIAAAAGVEIVDVAGAMAILARTASENVYAIDVRTKDEYTRAHIPGFRWAPGGQLVQATDSFIAVKGGHMLLACDGYVRACMTGAWLKEMGFPNVSVLGGGKAAWLAGGHLLEVGMATAEPFGYSATLDRTATVSPADLALRREREPALRLLFTGTSEEFSAGHVLGSTWMSRSWLEIEIGSAVPDVAAPIVVTDADGIASKLAAATLLHLGYGDVQVLEGGTRAWAKAGHVVETGLAGVARAPNDVLPASRSYAEMLNYLRWEEELGHKYAARRSALQN